MKTLQRNDKGLTAKLVGHSALASLSSVSFGICMMTLQGVRDLCLKTNVTNTWFSNGTHFSPAFFGMLSSIIAIGAFLSNLTCGLVPASFKSILIGNNFVFLLGMAIQYTMYNQWVLLVGRFIVGFAIGVTCFALPQYLAWISTVSTRGTIGCFHPLGIVVGISCGQVSCYFFNTEENWRYTYYFAFSFIIAHTGALFYLKKDTQVSQQAAPSERSYTEEQLQTPQQTTPRQNYGPFALLGLKQGRKSLIFAVVLHLAQQFSGVNPILLYSDQILEKAGFNKRLGTIYLGFSQITFLIISTLIVDRFGRKTMMSVSCFICGFTMFLLSFQKFVLPSLILFFFGFNMALGPVVWFITSEIFPKEWISAGCTIAVSVNWLSNFFVSYVGQFLLLKFEFFAFLPFAVSMLLILLYVQIFTKETKGKEPAFM